MKIREWIQRLMADRSDRDLASEMRFHLDMETQVGRLRGLSEDEAHWQAVLRAGSVSSAVEHLRDQRTLPWLTGTASDLRRACTACSVSPDI